MAHEHDHESVAGTNAILVVFVVVVILFLGYLFFRYVGFDTGDRTKGSDINIQVPSTGSASGGGSTNQPSY